MNLLAELLSSRVRAEIFRHLFDGRGEELHMRELERRSGFSIGTIQAELAKLVRLGLLHKRRDGNRLYFRANRDHPVYPEIRGMVTKTVGAVGLLQQTLADCEDVDFAFLFGSVARGEEQAGSDIDLMILGSIGLRTLAGVLAGVAGKVGREINPHVMDVEEYVKRGQGGEHFVTELVSSPKILIKGQADDLEKLV